MQIIKMYTILAIGENRATMHYFSIFRALCDEMNMPLLCYVFETRVLNSMNVLLVVILIFCCWIFYDLISFFIVTHTKDGIFREYVRNLY